MADGEDLRNRTMRSTRQDANGDTITGDTIVDLSQHRNPSSAHDTHSLPGGIRREVTRTADPGRTTVVSTTHLPPDFVPGSTRATSAMAASARPEMVSFNRRELDTILRVYGFKVAEGEWRDYAIDMLKDRAVFSVFRRAHDTPLHCIEKTPKLSRKQGQYSVTGAKGQILKRGHDLATVLKVLEKKPKLRLV